MKRLLNEFSDEPLFNIKAVEQQTGITAATLRAWERRYQLLTPRRTEGGYRLYSERDIALLHWVHDQMLSGLTVSRAVAMLQALEENSEPIWIDLADLKAETPSRNSSPFAAEFTSQLYQALIDLDGDRADHITSRIFAVHSIIDACVDVVAPTLVAIGEAWANGEIRVLQEHFASSYLRGRLMNLMRLFVERERAPHLFVGCAPGELHEIGAIIFSILARQRGYRVSFLGQNVPIDDMLSTLAIEQPAMVVMTASMRENALMLIGVEDRIVQESGGLTTFGYGGYAFDRDPTLRELISGTYLGQNFREAIRSLEGLMPLIR